MIRLYKGEVILKPDTKNQRLSDSRSVGTGFCAGKCRSCVRTVRRTTRKSKPLLPRHPAVSDVLNSVQLQTGKQLFKFPLHSLKLSVIYEHVSFLLVETVYTLPALTLQSACKFIALVVNDTWKIQPRFETLRTARAYFKSNDI
jgi:hypothetical protein